MRRSPFGKPFLNQLVKTIALQERTGCRSAGPASRGSWSIKSTLTETSVVGLSRGSLEASFRSAEDQGRGSAVAFPRVRSCEPLAALGCKASRTSRSSTRRLPVALRLPISQGEAAIGTRQKSPSSDACARQTPMMLHRARTTSGRPTFEACRLSPAPGLLTIMGAISLPTSDNGVPLTGGWLDDFGPFSEKTHRKKLRTRGVAHHPRRTTLRKVCKR